MKKLLAIFAHPDDETFTLGGTIAKYAKSDWKVDLISATHGEAGQRGFYEGADGDLATIRKSELAAAAAILGIHSVTFLDFKDGGLSNTSPGDIEDKLVQHMIVSKPDVVVTFGTDGFTNHPDHMRLSYAVTFAFQSYAKMRAQHDKDDETSPKLYYVCMPEGVASYLTNKKVYDEELYGKPLLGVADKLVSAVIDIKRFSAIKKKALLAHKSQQQDVQRFLELSSNPLLKQEYLVLRMVGTSESFMGKNDNVSDRL